MSGAVNVYTKDAPFHYALQSQAVKTPTAIYLSGSIPLTADGKFVEGTIAEKTRQCILNLKAIVEEAGSSVEKIVKVNIFLADMDNFAEMNSEYEKWFSHKPARSCVAVKTLPKNVDVEIEAIALPADTQSHPRL
ncbi:protein hmf1 [Verticillium dahliae]